MKHRSQKFAYSVNLFVAQFDVFYPASRVSFDLGRCIWALTPIYSKMSVFICDKTLLKFYLLFSRLIQSYF